MSATQASQATQKSQIQHRPQHNSTNTRPPNHDDFYRWFKNMSYLDALQFASAFLRANSSDANLNTLFKFPLVELVYLVTVYVNRTGQRPRLSIVLSLLKIFDNTYIHDNANDEVIAWKRLIVVLRRHSDVLDVDIPILAIAELVDILYKDAFEHKKNSVNDDVPFPNVVKNCLVDIIFYLMALNPDYNRPRF